MSIKQDYIEVENIYNKDGEQTLNLTGDQGIVVSGAANIDGLLDVNTGTANTVAIFESTDDKAFIRIKDDDTDTYLISKDNKFSIGESSTDYDNFKIDITSGNTTIAGTIGSGAITSTGAVEGTSFVKTGGAPSGFLKADGSVDSNTYVTGAHATDFVSAANGGTFSGNVTVGSNSLTAGSLDINGAADISGNLTSGAHTINSGTDGILILNQTGDDTGWSYINFNTSGTRNYFIGQDASKNFDIYNDNVDGTAIGIGYADNNITFGGNVTAGSNSLTAGSLDINGNADISGTTALGGVTTITNTSTGALTLNGGTGVSTTGAFVLRQNGDAASNGMAITSSDATSHRLWKDASGNFNIGSSSNADAFKQDTTGNVTIEGNITVSGTVDGRDLSADGTKLDGIEASADVTDTENVTSAGALMDTELTDLTGVKGVTISTLQPKPSEGAFANGDKTKLDGIATGAEVNVQSDWDATSGDAFIQNKPTIPSGDQIIDWTQSSAGIIHTDNYIENVVQTTVSGSSGSCTGNAATATALATTRAFQTNLASTSSANFDGSAANTHGVTGALAVGNGGTGNTSFSNKNLLVSNGSTIAGSGNLQWDSSTQTLELTSVTDNKPIINLQTAENGSGSGEINFLNPVAGEASDDVGEIKFKGLNAGSDDIIWAKILAEIETADDTDEAGKLSLTVACSDGTTSALQRALVATGHGTSNIVSVGLGYGATSTTTIAGTLTMGTTPAMTNAGLLSVADQSNITGLGIISSGTWEGTTIATDQGGTGSTSTTYCALGSNVSGTLPVGNGGTGATSLTDGGILLGGGSGAITAMSVLADGEMIVGDGTTDPVAESGATLRASIGCDEAGTDNSTAVTLAGSLGYITLSGQELTRNAIDLAADVTGVLPHTNIGGDAINGDNIADDSINSEHYVDGSVDYAHIQDVTNARMLGNDTGSDGVVTEMTAANVRSFINVAAGAEVNVQSDWDAVSGDSQILNKPSIPSISGLASETYVDTAVSNLVDSAPVTLDTLNELAAALGDDASFSTTVTNSIAAKLPLAGGTMTGNIVMSGAETVDGRDLSADGTKLDGIENNATADQTNAEIRAAVEAATDSNVFTDADHTKLNGIENNATADQTQGDINGLAITTVGTIGTGVWQGDPIAPGYIATLNQNTTGTAAIATTVTVADESSSTTCFPLFATAATGDLPPKSGSNLRFDSSAGILTSTNLVATAQVTAKRYNITLSGGGAGTNGGAEIVYWGTNTVTTAGKIYYYNGSGAWALANATAVATCKGLLAVAAGMSSATNGMILNGCVTLNHDPGDIGDVLYLDTAAPGQAINTISDTQNHVVRVIGYQIEYASGGKIYFNPDNTFVEIA